MKLIAHLKLQKNKIHQSINRTYANAIVFFVGMFCSLAASAATAPTSSATLGYQIYDLVFLKIYGSGGGYAAGVLMLFWAFNPNNPYGYYILLRWVCCGVFAYLAISAYKQKNNDWIWIFGITAAIYNPIIPVHLTRVIWSVFNIITIGILVTSVITQKKLIENLRNSNVLNKRKKM